MPSLCKVESDGFYAILKINSYAGLLINNKIHP